MYNQYTAYTASITVYLYATRNATIQIKVSGSPTMDWQQEKSSIFTFIADLPLAQRYSTVLVKWTAL